MHHFCHWQSSTRLPQTQICLSSQLLGCSWSLVAQGASEAAGSTGGFTSACLLLYCSSVILQVRDCFNHNGDAVPVFSWALIGRSPSVTSCISKPHKSVVCCFRTVTQAYIYVGLFCKESYFQAWWFGIPVTHHSCQLFVKFKYLFSLPCSTGIWEDWLLYL